MTDTYLRSGKNLPELFGKHLLLAKLATGGMGEVFLARMQSATGFEKLLVLKRLLPHLSEDPRFVAMFLDEAKIAARISHANVCQIYELGSVDGQFYMTMEYLEGVSLSTVIERRNLDPKLADMRFLCGLLTQVCEGLHCAHALKNEDGTSAGVVHRDVCLSNIYVTWSGAAKLIDFGVAKTRGVVSKTRPGAVKGTYAYMSPEQLRGEEVDARSDIFSLGVVAWETFAGRRLYKRDSDYKTFKAITEEPIPKVSKLRPEVPPAISRAVERALAREPDARFQTARGFGKALAAASENLGPPMLALACGQLMAETFSPVIDRHRARVVALYRIGAEKLREEGTATKEMPIRRGRITDPPEQETIPQVRLPLVTPKTAIGARMASEAAVEFETFDDPLPSSAVETDGLDESGASARELPGAVLAPAAATSAVAPGAATVDRRSNRAVPVLVGLIAVIVAIILVVLIRGTGGGALAVEESATTPTPAPAEADRVDVDRGEIAPPVATSSQPPAPTAAPPPTAMPVKKKPRPRRVRPVKTARVAPPRTGQVTLQSNPYATIYIDGKKLGYTPIVGHTLSAGAHTLRAVSSANGSEQNLTITVTPDNHLRRMLKW